MLFRSRLLRSAELEVHAGALDIALRQGWVELDGLGEISHGVVVLAKKAAEGSAEVIGEGLVLAQVAELQRLIKGLPGLLVALARLLLHRGQAELQLAEASVIGKLDRLGQSIGTLLDAEALQVVANKGVARELDRAVGQHLLSLLLGELLQEALDGLGARLVLEAVDDAGRGEVEQGLAIHLEVLVGVCATVQRLDVLGIEVNGSSGVFDNLVPVSQCVEAGGTVRVEDGVGLADDGLGVEVDGPVVLLGPVGFVAGVLELGGIVVALLLRERLDGLFVNLGKLFGGLGSRGLWLRRRRLCGGRNICLCRLSLCLLLLSPLLLAELGGVVGLGLFWRLRHGQWMHDYQQRGKIVTGGGATQGRGEGDVQS